MPRKRCAGPTLTVRLGTSRRSRHQLIDACCRPTVDELRQRVGEPGVRINAVELGRLDERGDDGPVGATLVAAGEQRILAVQGDRPDGTLDNVGVDLDASVIEKAAEALPMARAVTHGLGDGCSMNASGLNCI